MNNELAGKTPALDLSRIWRLFRQTYVSHFFFPSLIFFALAMLAPGEYGEAVAFLFGSALPVSASQRALTGTPVFSEMSIRHIILRGILLFALFCMLGVFIFFLMVPLAVVSKMLENDWMVYAVLALAVAAVTARIWPVYVVHYLFRGPQAEKWRTLFPPKTSDAAVAWKLTRPVYSFRRASFPVLVTVLSAILLYHVLSQFMVRSKFEWFVVDIFFYMGVLPLVHLLLMERAFALAMGCEQTVAASVEINRSGNPQPKP